MNREIKTEVAIGIVLITLGLVSVVIWTINKQSSISSQTIQGIQPQFDKSKKEISASDKKASRAQKNISNAPYENTKYKYKIEYPGNWTLTECELGKYVAIDPMAEIDCSCNDGPCYGGHISISIEDKENAKANIVAFRKDSNYTEQTIYLDGKKGVRFSENIEKIKMSRPATEFIFLDQNNFFIQITFQLRWGDMIEEHDLRENGKAFDGLLESFKFTN